MMKENMDLKVARVKRKMSQWELSYQTGIAQSRISLFEKGFRKPTQEQAEKIAETLQVAIEEIFPDLISRWQKSVGR